MTDRQGKLLTTESQTDEPVECLGLTFKNDDERRIHFREKLRQKLNDPGFRKTPGFPQGSDEEILRLSDPPFYTACPNPFLEDFIRCYGKPYEPAETYHREPFAVDVSEGKTDALYKAHGYHTKVPHLAIVPSILHYTSPGDIVLDGFCGSGMTGVAAQWCGIAPAEYRHKVEGTWRQAGLGKPEWGTRHAVLGDLSPAATFIAGNYNLPFDVEKFERAAKRLLKQADDDIGWMYETLHTDGRTKGRINFTVWSEVFACPECGSEIVFVREALDEKTKRIKDEFPCPDCASVLTKSRLERLYTSRFDTAVGQTAKAPKRLPVLIDYTVGNKKYEKAPDESDLKVLERIDARGVPTNLPVDRMMHAPPDVECWGDEWRAGVASFSHVHQLFLPRAAQSLSTLWELAEREEDVRLRNALIFFVEQAVLGMSLLNRYSPLHFSQVNRYMAGRIRVLSQHSECSPWYILNGKLQRLVKAFSPLPCTPGGAAVSLSDCATTSLPDCSVDYVFTDPPFGDNLAYAELNFVNEAFLRLFTNSDPEAIVSNSQKKGLLEYQHLMERCFSAYCRVLKPGRWMTVVFHNSKNAVWNAIQEAMLVAGFVVADVRTLDKQQGTFNQVNAGRAVKQDLVISAYKPNGGLERRFEISGGTEDGVWEFIRTHLKQLPVFVARDGEAETIAERQGYFLYDRMVAFHVQRGVTVPLSAAEFYQRLEQHYAERDGMWFLPEQVAEYDRKRLTVREVLQLQIAVSDEQSAVEWMRQQLLKKPQTFQELQPQFMEKTRAGWQKHEKSLELAELLELNFLRYDGSSDVPSQIHSYLSTNFKELRKLQKGDAELRAKGKDRWYVPDPKKAEDLEKLRERALLREFEDYRDAKQKRLKVFRLEAVRAGFKKAWQERDYETIIVVAQKIPENVLQEDPKLLMWYDQALTRTGDEE